MSFETDAAGVLTAQVERINQFLGVTTPPILMVDERGPGPDPAEMERQLQRLAEKYPRLAGWLRRWSGQSESKRGESPRC